jgi:hypothetical protein
MNRTLLVLALLLVSATPPCAAADAQVAPTDSAVLVTLTQSLLDAVTHGDSAVWAPHLSPSWFLIDEEGNRLSRAEFLAGLRPLPAGQSGSLRIGDRYLAGAGDVVVLSYAIEEEHDYHGQHLRTRFHTTDTWVRRHGGWRMLASQVTALPTQVAGRALPRALLEEYAGTYALTDEITLEVGVADDGLRLVRAPTSAEPLRALNESIFVRDGRRGFWVFERDAAGAVARLVSWRDNNAVVWRRR